MRITYDPKYDSLYLKIGGAEKVLCKEIAEDITLDMDSQGKLTGIEILSASEHLDLEKLLPLKISMSAVKKSKQHLLLRK